MFDFDVRGSSDFDERRIDTARKRSSALALASIATSAAASAEDRAY